MHTFFLMLASKAECMYHVRVERLPWPQASNSVKKKLLDWRAKITEGLVEVTLTSSQDQSGITTKLWRNHLEKTTEK